MSRDTQDRILQAALHLFSENGYAATSIRQIAQAADVNVAAINYHFKSKKGLLFSVIERGHSVLSQAIDGIDTGPLQNLGDFVITVFRVLLNHSDMILNSKRLLLSPDCVKMEEYGLNSSVCGPPGGEKMLCFIRERTKLDLTEDDEVWLLQSLFGLLFHWSQMIACPLAKAPASKHLFEQTTIEKNLRRTAMTLAEKLTVQCG